MPLGQRRMFVAFVRDITKRKYHERLKGEFVATVSHELRTPMTSIAGSLGLLMGGAAGQLPDPAKRLLGIAHSNSQRLVRLINDILDIEKIESGKLTLFSEPMPMDELVNESMKLNQGFADRYKVRLVATGLASEVRVNADRKRLLQVMTNLISNAAKFSPADGSVDIEMRQVNDRIVVISVGDRGKGIPEDFRNRIFGRFAQADSADTRAKGGTGLGLAICKRLIEMMDGTIGFSDRPGGGTSFWFELPMHKAN
jgi:signal transduction histidine kinase